MNTSDNKKDDREANAAFFFNRAAEFEKDGHYKMAHYFYAAVLDIDPYHGAAWNKRGDYYKENGEQQEALEDLYNATLVDPKNAAFKYDYAEHLFDIRRFKEAAISFLELSEMTPDEPDIEYNLGRALLYANQIADAFGHFQKARDIANKEQKAPIAKKAEEEIQQCMVKAKRLIKLKF